MSSFTGPPSRNTPSPPTGEPAILSFSLDKGLPISLKHAIEQDNKRRLPCPYITVLYMDHFDFSYKDIHRILLNKKFIGAEHEFSDAWAGFYRRLPAEAAVIMTNTQQNVSDYNWEGLGKFLAQGQKDMEALDFSMYLGASHMEGNHVEGLDATVDEKHDAHPVRIGADGKDIQGNLVRQAAWYAVYPDAPSILP